MKVEHPYRILIVDDDQSLHRIFSSMLAPATDFQNPEDSSALLPSTRELSFPQFTIDFASQGEEGLACVRKALAEQRPYTMAFVDMRMPPGWDGIETISHIWKECFDLQIVICTGYTDFSWHDLIREFGHSDRLLIMKKPFDLTEIRQVAYSLAEKWDLAHQAQSHLQRLQKLVSERTARLQEANLSLQRKIIENKHAERRLLTQYSVNQALDHSSTLVAAMDAIFPIICGSLGWEWGGLWRLNPETNALQLVQHWHISDDSFNTFTELSQQAAFGPGTGLPGQVWSSGQSIWMQDVSLDAGFKRAEALTQHGLHGAIGVPIFAGVKFFGVLEFLSREIRERDKDGLQTFIVIASALGQFIERKQADRERARMEIELRHAQKMESIGHLAAGIAHEINTPTQYIGDNIRFLETSFADLQTLHEQYRKLLAAAKENAVSPELITATEKAGDDANVEFLIAEIPRAIQQTLEGVDRVGNIVRAMKDFSHPGTGEKTLIDLNKAIETTITVARNEWKYVAQLTMDFDKNLPHVPCLPGELNQVILNLVVNAAHAITESSKNGTSGLGFITASTRLNGEWAEIRIRDTGTGIPEKIRGKIFDPFFTTKPVGKGTGQGLAIAHTVIVEQHQGQLTFETQEGTGTTFIIRLPLVPPARVKSGGKS